MRWCDWAPLSSCTRLQIFTKTWRQRQGECSGSFLFSCEPMNLVFPLCLNPWHPPLPRDRCRPPPCVSPSPSAAQWCSAASSLQRFTSSCFSPRKTWPRSGSRPAASAPQCLLLPPLPAPATRKVPASLTASVWQPYATI